MEWRPRIRQSAELLLYLDGRLGGVVQKHLHGAAGETGFGGVGAAGEDGVVVPHACWRPTFGRIRGIRIGRGHLVLAMRGLFYRILSFKFCQVLAHRSINLRSFGQLLSRDAALRRSVCLHECSINR